jgi:predicted DNA binding CopG/RHH family protein
MKYYELTKEEEKILDAVENGKFISRPKSEIKKYKLVVKSTLDKTKNINIRLSLRDFMKLKTKAVEKGIPYQTLVASVIHQYTDKTTS